MKQISVDGVTYGVGDVRGLRERAEKAEARVVELERLIQDGLEIADAGGVAVDIALVLTRANIGPAPERTTGSVSAMQNEIKTYNLKDTIAWLREIIGPRGTGEHSSVEQKQAARTILAIMPDDNECEHEVERSTGQCIYCTTTIDVPESRSSNVPPGPCTGRLPALTAGVYTCTLREGHAGQHLADNGVSWTEPDEQRPSDACSKCGAVDPGDVYVYGMSFLSTENGKRICRDRDACARHSNDARIGYPCACTWVGKNEEARATLKPCEMHRIWAEGLRLDKVQGTGTLLLASGICLTSGEVDEVLAARRTDYPPVGSKVRKTCQICTGRADVLCSTGPEGR